MLTFSDRVVKLALSIPPGRVTTYGRLARAAGSGNMAAQSITTILSRAWGKDEKRIPWHRIVYSNGKIWIDDRHYDERMRLYRKEGIALDASGHIKDFHRLLFEFT